jgi:hypothetical protein
VLRGHSIGLHACKKCLESAADHACLPAGTATFI